MSADESSTDALVTEIDVRATPERVFAALTDPAQRVRWWGAAGKFQAEAMESDLRPGGRWSMRGSGPGGRAFVMSGEYRVVDPPRVLEFTWQPDWPEATTVVRFDLLPRDGGVTTVRLTHSGFDSPDTRGRYRGWMLVLSMLRSYVDRPIEGSQS